MWRFTDKEAAGLAPEILFGRKINDSRPFRAITNLFQILFRKVFAFGLRVMFVHNLNGRYFQIFFQMCICFQGKVSHEKV